MNTTHEVAGRHDRPDELPEQSVSIARTLTTIRRYLPAITVILASVALAYLIIAILTYLIGSSTKVTTLPFRLEFSGAAEGFYPNGTRFSPTDIVSTPILLHVYQANDLGRYVDFERFSRSVVILESNLEYEKLVGAYRARLADTRLTAVDRQRLEHDFELKLESISKNAFAIQYLHSRKRVPETLIRKTLSDTLQRWAHLAVKERNVTMFYTSVLGPDALDPAFLERDFVAAIQILRSRLWRLSTNLEELQARPGGVVARTQDGLSLAELSIRVEELLRFRLEPLITSAWRSNLDNPVTTMQFLRAQLAYDQRQLNAANERAEAIRQALAVYSREQRTFAGSSTSQPSDSRPVASGETVMPQISESFLDRIVALASESADTRYRQQLADEYRTALNAAISFGIAVDYDHQLIEQIQSVSQGGGGPDAAAVRADLLGIQNELREIVARMNEIYVILSRNLNPTGQLLTLTAPPFSRVERAIALTNLALYGFLVLLIAIPLTIAGVLLHNRAREEEAELQAERAERPEAATI
jgi:hypothetical protein